MDINERHDFQGKPLLARILSKLLKIIVKFDKKLAIKKFNWKYLRRRFTIYCFSFENVRGIYSFRNRIRNHFNIFFTFYRSLIMNNFTSAKVYVFRGRSDWLKPKFPQNMHSPNLVVKLIKYYATLYPSLVSAPVFLIWIIWIPGH